MKPPRRVPKPFTVEVRLASRQSRAKAIDKQPDWPELREEPAKPAGRPPEPVEAPPAADVPAGRVLPALDEPAPIPAATETRTPRQPRVRRPVHTASITDDVAAPGADPRSTAVAAGPVAPAPVHHAAAHRLPRLPRSAYPLGERWKARLPALRHELSGKGRRTPN